MAGKIFNRLSVKVFLISFIVQVLSGVLICFVLYSQTPEMLYSPFDELDDLIEILADTPRDEGEVLIDDFIRRNDVDIVIYDDYEIGYYNEPIDSIGELTLKSKLEVDEAMKKLADGGIASYGLVFADDKTDYLLTCYDYGYHENLIPRGLAQSYPLMIAVVVSISLVSSIVYTLLFALPVKKLSRVSRRMAQMDFTARCDSKRGDEIGDLARDLNLMSSTLDNKIRELEEEIRRVRELESQKEMFFAAASHELKTPVTVLEGHIRGMIEGVGPYEDHDEYLARSLRTVKRMESLINEILTASKMQSFDDVERTRIDMAKILKSKLSESEELFSIRNIMVVEDTEDELYFSGNAELTSLALGAFISNAVFYSGEGSRIDNIARNDSGKITVYIKNRDAHIDEKDLPHLFEAFYRSDSSRNRRDGGSGLGLYLARLIITKQDGECSLYNDGEGVTAEIIFPST